MTKHTPTPQLGFDVDKHGTASVYTMAEGGMSLMVGKPVKRELFKVRAEHAAFIVRAVNGFEALAAENRRLLNAHDGMTTALVMLLEDLRMNGAKFHDDDERIQLIINALIPVYGKEVFK